MSKNSPINKKTSALTVNSAYSLPTTDGDADEIIETDGSGNLSWTAPAVSDILVQEVANSTSSAVQINAQIPRDDTIPQKTEGTEIITCSITPTSSTNILLIEVSSYISWGDCVAAIYAIFQDDTSNALAAIADTFASSPGASRSTFTFRHRMVAGTTSSTTFKFRAGTATKGVYSAICGTSTTGNLYGGVSSCIITVQEYEA